MLKATMAWFLIIMLNIMCIGGCSASENSAQVTPLSVFIFSNALFEADFNPGGEYIRSQDISPLIREYKEFKQWNPAEASSSPNEVDAIAVISNTSSKVVKGISIKFEVYEKIGPLVLHEVYGVTDVPKGKKEAVWSSAPSITEIVKVERMEAGIKKSIKLANINLKNLLAGKKESKKWPFEIKVVAKVECEACGAGVAEKTIEVLPGD